MSDWFDEMMASLPPEYPCIENCGYKFSCMQQSFADHRHICPDCREKTKYTGR